MTRDFQDLRGMTGTIPGYSLTETLLPSGKLQWSVWYGKRVVRSFRKLDEVNTFVEGLLEGFRGRPSVAERMTNLTPK